MRLPAFAFAALGALLFQIAQAGVINSERPLWPPTPDPARADSPGSERTFRKLNSIILPRLKFEKADVSEVLDFLTAKSAELDPGHRGVSFCLDLHTPLKPDGLPPIYTFSSNVTDTTLSQALIWLEVQTDLQYRVVQGVVIFQSQPASAWDASLPDVSVSHPLKLIMGECVGGYYDVPGGDTPEGGPVNEKLNSMTLPDLDITDQDIADVLRILSQRSKELDPDHVGVQIRLNLTPIRHTVGHSIQRKISLHLKSPSLAEGLAILCECSRTGYSIEKGVVVLRPLLSY